MISSAATKAANKAMAAKEAEEMSKYAISVSESNRQLFYGIMASECGARWDYNCLMMPIPSPTVYVTAVELTCRSYGSQPIHRIFQPDMAHTPQHPLRKKLPMTL